MHPENVLPLTLRALRFRRSPRDGGTSPEILFFDRKVPVKFPKSPGQLGRHPNSECWERSNVLMSSSSSSIVGKVSCVPSWEWACSEASAPFAVNLMIATGSSQEKWLSTRAGALTSPICTSVQGRLGCRLRASNWRGLTLRCHLVFPFFREVMTHLDFMKGHTATPRF
jgi:hypothetical protein